MSKPVERAFGRRVREKRQKLGWTLRELSDKCGLTIAFLSDLENGKRGVGLGNAVHLSSVLGVRVQTMIAKPYDYGVCPHCEGRVTLKLKGGNVRCDSGHVFPDAAIIQEYSECQT